MTRVIFNADDFGYSEAVTLGIIKAHKDGVIVSTTMMTNMDSAPIAAEWSKSYPNLFVGQHTNIVVGKPCSDPTLIPSLVDENGYFNTKHRQEKGLPLDREHIKIEVRAQAERFKQLMGYYPEHIEGHAIRDAGLFWAIKEVATELGVHYTDVEQNFLTGESIRNANQSGYEIPDYPDIMYYMDQVSLDYWLKDKGNLLSKDLVQIHSHPGYVDQYLLDHSSYTLTRAKEVEIACSPQIKEWAKMNNVTFISHKDIKKL